MQAGKQDLSASPSKDSGLRPIDEDLFEDNQPPKQKGGIIAALKRRWQNFGKKEQSEQADDWSDDDKW